MKNSWLLLLLLPFLIVSCNGNDVFVGFKPIASKGWSKDSVYTFDVKILDTLATYNVYVNVRNKGDYPYQNLWIFVQKLSPDSVIVNDSIECYLADQRGKWLGRSAGSLFEMPILYQQNVHFSKVGNYHYTLLQGMRDTLLVGVNDIGMRVEKVEKNN